MYKSTQNSCCLSQVLVTTEMRVLDEITQQMSGIPCVYFTRLHIAFKSTVNIQNIATCNRKKMAVSNLFFRRHLGMDTIAVYIVSFVIPLPAVEK